MAKKVSIKSAADIEMARKAGAMAAEVLHMIGEHVRPGVTTDELDRICNEYIVNVLKAIPANVGYHGFPKTICASVNHVICHGIPSAKVLKNGDILNIDVAVIKDGWFGDTSRMYYVGQPSPLAPPGQHHLRSHPRRDHGSQARRDAGRYRPCHPDRRAPRAFQHRARILRPRHRAGLSRRPPGVALRAGRATGHCAASRHDLHH